MKNISSFLKQATKSSIVVSVLNAEVPSLTEELILRTGKKLSESRDIEHYALILRNAVNESEVTQNFLGQFSGRTKYYNSISEARQVLHDFDVKDIVCEAELASEFKNAVLIKPVNHSLVESAISGNFDTFKRYSPNNMREVDCSLLFNLVRESHNLENINLSIDLPKNNLREQFFKGEIFNIGETVEYRGNLHEILDRGSNYLVIVDTAGNVRKSWMADLKESAEKILWGNTTSENEIFFKGYQTKNFHLIGEDTRIEFNEIIEKNVDSYLILETIKIMDSYIKSQDRKLSEKLSANLGKIYKLQEDVMTSDFKMSKDGRRIRAHRISFNKDKADSQEDKDAEEVKEAFDDKLEYHDVMNPKLWKDDALLKPVEDKLKQIADAFEEFLDKDGKIIPVLDVIITGSNCNFNYTPQSDIDLHLIVDLDKIEDKELIAAYLTAKKTIWASAHDIKIKGYDVELYAQDKDDKLVATGMYSIRKNKWIEKPSNLKLKIDHFTVQAKACDIINQIENVIHTKNDDTVAKIDELKEKIRKLRSAGLSKGGEFSVENLAFKAIRNNGYFEKLNNLKKEISDKKLSLEQFVVMDKSRTDNAASGIMNADDLKKLRDKLKQPMGHTFGDREDLRIRKIKYKVD